jgi:hypothetical protein
VAEEGETVTVGAELTVTVAELEVIVEVGVAPEVVPLSVKRK